MSDARELLAANLSGADGVWKKKADYIRSGGDDVLIDGRDALAAIEAALRSGDEWEPIETAPKDGTWFMTTNIDAAGPEPEIEIGAHDPILWDEYVPVADDLFRKERKTVYEWRGFNNFHRATHWRPLPSPPAREG